MTEDDLKTRTKQFALRVIKLGDSLPATTTGRAIGNQLICSSTSVGAIYRSACGGRSRAEFIAKPGTVKEEADESAFWLELIVDSAFLKSSLVHPLLTKATELTASIISAKRNSHLQI